jgi:hypothetical protein
VSRQSKNARNKERAKAYTKMHLNGEKGPAKTVPKHGKKWTYRQNPTAMKALAEKLKSSTPGTTKTAGAEILAKAGGALLDDGDE